MQSSNVRSTTIYGLLALILCFGGCDAWLLHRLKQQDAVIANLTYENSTISQSPVPGQSIPLLQGIDLQNNKPSAIKLSASPRMFLLVFSQTCKFCEENWLNWEDLLKSHKLGTSVYLISSDESLSKDYLDRHPVLKQSSVLIDVDPAVFQAFNVTSTPQTIYIVAGKVQQDWVGVLRKQDLNEIGKLKLGEQ